jgi:hypothetical protein
MEAARITREIEDKLRRLDTYRRTHEVTAARTHVDTEVKSGGAWEQDEQHEHEHEHERSKQARKVGNGGDAAAKKTTPAFAAAGDLFWGVKGSRGVGGGGGGSHIRGGGGSSGHVISAKSGNPNPRNHPRDN